MLTCIKDWELGERRLHHAVYNQELEDSFKNLYLDEDESRAATGTTGASATSGATSTSGTGGTSRAGAG